ncbi:MAG: sigma-70 family RNA polymerase sigma factor [Bacteroidota bacterium]
MQRNRIARQKEPDRLKPASIQETFEGDHRDEFERTAVPHMTVLYNHAMHLTMNSDDAKDLLQETYLRAYRFWDKFEMGTNIKGWLYQIMKNSYINHYRKRVKEPKPVEFDESLFHHNPVPDTPTQLHPVVGEQDSYDVFEDEIARSLESLPGDFRTVVMLSDMEDFTYEEIASMVAVPIGTVRSRLHRGRRLLRERLRNYTRSNRYLI